MKKTKLIAIGIGLAIVLSMVIGAGVTVFAPSPAKSAQMNTAEQPQGQHLQVNLNEHMGVQANP